MRILIVEDNPVVLGMLSLVLDREKFIVDNVATGEEAFEKARDTNYDLIILDLLLPGKSGFEVISALRSLEINTPILVISSLSDVDSKTRALDLGADDFMVKDLCVTELLSRIKCLMRRVHGNAKNILQCGNLVLDLSEMVVRRGGLEIFLTKKELGILAYLFQKREKIVTKKELMDTVWGEGEIEANSNKLNVHIRSLRKKIDGAFEIKYIHTVRGYGFRLAEKEVPGEELVFEEIGDIQKV